MSLNDQLQSKINALMPILINEAVTWTQNNFKSQQWEGAAWQGRKKETRLSKGKPLLVSRRDLYNAIRALGPNSFGVIGIPYARIHNQGGTITHPARTRQMTFKKYKAGKFKGKTLFHKNNEKASFSRKAESGAYTITIPKRQFIGNTPELKKHLVQIAKDYLH